jgi:pimeloyl-ACP methyl ester carboxylesterase
MQWRRLGRAFALGMSGLAGVCAQPAHPQADADAAAWMEVPGASAELVPETHLGGRVMLYRAGRRDGRAVVLIHGLGQSGARDWRKLIPALAQGYAVYALDLPGFGQSDKGNRLYSPANFAAAIENVIGRRVESPFVLVGHSMGGAVSLAYAAAYPQRVERLVLVDVAGVLHRAVYAEFLSRLGTHAASGGKTDDAPWFTAFLHTMLTRAESIPVSTEPLLGSAAVRQQMFRGDPNAIAAYTLVGHDFSRALRSIAVPTLLIWGSEDKVAPLRTGQMAAATIPNARLAVLQGAGHAPMLQSPERFNATVLEELRGKPHGPPYALQQAAIEGARVGVCNGERGRQFSGDYKEIRLDNCPDTQITAARIGFLLVRDSTLRIVNSHIDDGIDARSSRLEITAGSVGGSPALGLNASDVDAAGTRFQSEGPIAVNRGSVRVALSLSVVELARPGAEPRYVHRVVALAPRARW